MAPDEMAVGQHTLCVILTVTSDGSELFDQAVTFTKLRAKDARARTPNV